jgi:hypothetical protein
LGVLQSGFERGWRWRHFRRKKAMTASLL